MSAAENLVLNETFENTTLNSMIPFNDSIFLSNSTSYENAIVKSTDVQRYFPLIVAEMIVSCVFLIVSITVYSTVSEFKNVHGKNLIAMSSSLLITFVLLILDLIIRKHVSFSVCFSIAMIIHFTFLANFFWTNVMTFDIWRTLTQIKAKGGPTSSNKFFKYSIYAWTATFFTALPSAILELTDWIPSEFKPKFGEKRCWLSGKTAFIYYFNLPVGVILFSNLVMFILTIRKLLILKKMTAILNIKQQQQRLNLYLKLFLVMGITWTTEFIPWITNINWLYAIAGMITAMHGLVLFSIFVAKKRILRQFYNILLKRKEFATKTGSSQLNSSLTGNHENRCKTNLNSSKF